MVVPFKFPESGYRPDQWWFLIAAQSQVYFPQVTRFRRLFDAAGTVTELVTRVQVDRDDEPLEPDWVAVRYGDEALLTIQGSLNWPQIASQLVLTYREPWNLGPGLVSVFYKAIAGRLFNQMQHMVRQWAPRFLIVQGHSYGGAVAQLVARLLALDNPSLAVQVITWGAPAVGDPAYADGYPLPLVTVHVAGDRTVSIPAASSILLRIPEGFASFVAETLRRWKHAGIRYELQHDGAVLGEWVTGRRFPSNRLAFVSPKGFTVSALGLHMPAFYARAIRANLPVDWRYDWRFLGWANLPLVDDVMRDMGEHWGEPFDIRPA